MARHVPFIAVLTGVFGAAYAQNAPRPPAPEPASQAEKRSANGTDAQVQTDQQNEPERSPGYVMQNNPAAGPNDTSPHDGTPHPSNAVPPHR